ncbi:Uncharacterized protein PECH_003815 [Penicillium ucsense]|uniref:Phosphoglycerate mutase family protein n=1 Tax=Penicillium ucsense TaxID=2839758 RepID=A0A8J8VVX5_9EURO|nr:Uncharacterized protein PECM_003504 [Penicillium ucsense]KAF7729061.1 Uncharacterized protein PECH_003815 [Penicillium ucsense]
MGWFSDDSPHADAYQQYQSEGIQPQHEASFAHELLAGAASFEAAKAYEDHVARNGAPPNHAMAKELMAGFAAAFIDREVETRGMDFVDKERAKRQAREHIEREDESRFNY